MARKVIYWASTGVIAALMCFAAFTYLSGGPKVVEGFAGVGYPQQLRIILGIVKPLGVIALLVPGFVRLKEWAYAGFTYAWICACVAHYSAGQKAEAIFPLILLALLYVSYVMRPANRTWRAA
ncbi:MAG: DoxX family protein [Terriglobales bacterium]